MAKLTQASLVGLCEGTQLLYELTPVLGKGGFDIQFILSYQGGEIFSREKKRIPAGQQMLVDKPVSTTSRENSDADSSVSLAGWLLCLVEHEDELSERKIVTLQVINSSDTEAKQSCRFWREDWNDIVSTEIYETIFLSKNIVVLPAKMQKVILSLFERYKAHFNLSWKEPSHKVE